MGLLKVGEAGGGAKGRTCRAALFTCSVSSSGSRLVLLDIRPPPGNLWAKWIVAYIIACCIFSEDGTLAELKGFEVKRRGELQLV